MRNRTAVLMAMLAVQAGVMCRAEDTTNQPLRLELELADGSRVVGIPGITSLVIRTSFSTVQIPFSQILDLEIQGNQDSAVAHLRSGDQLTGKPETASLSLSTVFGKPVIGMDNIRRIAVRDGSTLSAVFEKSLVLYYSFDGDEGARISDRSSQRNNGTAQGAQFTPKGKKGGALQFDGVDDYVEAGNPPSLQLQTNFTLAAWIYPEQSAESFGIITKSHGYPEQQRRGIEFMLGHDDILSAYFWDESTQYFSGSAAGKTIPRETWTHVVLQHDSTLPNHQMRAFINGIPCPMNFGYEVVSSIPVVRNVAEPVRIGCMRPGNSHFKGRIDEVMIFDRVLPEDEIARLYKSTR